MICFVVLHYKNLDDTISCLQSIKLLDNQDNISIVVVDNNTLTSVEKMQLEKYTNNFVMLSENVGVAKAYDAGAKYAIEKIKPDFICVMNNDIEIEQKDFVNKVIKSYKKNKFDALGTKIICDGDSVNPFPVFDSLYKIDMRIKRNDNLIKIYSNVLLAVLFEAYLKVKHIIKKEKKLTNGEKIEKNVAIHGCLMIFSKKYFSKYNDILPNDTFLFHEEEFLFYRFKNENLLSVYDPSIEIIHKEGQAMKGVNKNSIKRKLFKAQECNKSLTILKHKLEKNEKI